MSPRTGVVAAIGTSQTIAWASSYYLPAVVAAPIGASLGVPTTLFFGIFSVALLLSAALGPAVGRLIDEHGGRAVLALSNAVLAAGLLVLAAARGMPGLIVAWALLGLGIAMGLYDPAFATLTRLYGRDARAPITGITLIAGFASTVGWPLTAFAVHAVGWRAGCVMWAALNLCLAMPLNWFAVPPPPPEAPPETPVAVAEPIDPPPGAMAILAFYFSATWFVTGAMAAHLPRLLQSAGATETAAIAAAALVGPAQVGARLVEFGLLRAFHPLVSGRLAALMHPLAAGLLLWLGGAGAPLFALVHGAGNGMITIVKGTLPLALFGAAGYGLRSGLLSAPARLTQSAAPFLFGLLLDRLGAAAVLLTASLSVAAFAGLLALRPSRPAAATAAP